ncbi:MAG TPA: PQQ-dependent sugar dehydrogenase, partial [Actinotalea sp.]|nr:PQQ-dependent sugar dehydrogenase [Actinotalea sp.]
PPANASPMDVATGLAAPWDLAFLPSGAVLVSLRDEAGLVVLTAAGPSDVGGEGADQLAADAFVEGEAGLLGVEVSPTFEQDSLVYLYRTTPDGNEVVRARLAPDLTLGPLEPLVVGVPHTWFHDGGRLAFGPDGFLYIATGDAGDRPLSQDQGSLAGKILRVTADGTPAPGNPVDGNPMWSYGHRNVQGLGWSEDGAMFASEFGANTWDELNVIAPGANYGWPAVEGVGGRAGFVDPVVTWRTQDASPSGIAVTADAVYVAALRGERLWKVPLVPGSPGEVGEPEVALDGLGRLRHVELGPDGALWVVTNNTDGRGSPRDGDDRIVRLTPP